MKRKNTQYWYPTRSAYDKLCRKRCRLLWQQLHKSGCPSHIFTELKQYSPAVFFSIPVEGSNHERPRPLRALRRPRRRQKGFVREGHKNHQCSIVHYRERGSHRRKHSPHAIAQGPGCSLRWVQTSTSSSVQNHSQDSYNQSILTNASI